VTAIVPAFTGDGTARSGFASRWSTVEACTGLAAGAPEASATRRDRAKLNQGEDFLVQ
jgi:hypothetical protein